METPWEVASREVDELYACECANKSYVYKLDSLGRKHYRLMCVRCRELKSQAVSVKNLPQHEIERIAEYDPEPCMNRRAEIQAAKKRRASDLRSECRTEAFSELQRRYDSPDWEKLRQKVFARCRRTCEGCGTAPATMVHHLTYERLWNEMLFDLVGVCRDCHEGIHPHLGDEAAI